MAGLPADPVQEGETQGGWPQDGRLDAIRKIAVLRPGAVGDFVFALPALHALKQTYPEANLVLVGKDWHRTFLHGRPGPVDRVVVMPQVPGVGAPVGAAAVDGAASAEAMAVAAAGAIAVTAATAATVTSTTTAASAATTPAGIAAAAKAAVTHAAVTPATTAATATTATGAATAPCRPDDAPAIERFIEPFIDAMRAERFDLALQMYGGGRYSNPFLLRFGARLTVGARAPDAPALDRWIAYREPTQRRLALLEIAGLAGARLRTLPPAQPELAVTPADRAEAATAVPWAPGERLIVLQPGSTDPRRCWPPACFAGIGDRLAGAGARIALNGAPAESALLEDVAQRMHYPAIRLAGRLSLGGLCGLLERTDLLVSNDTGPLHLALALGVPSVGIFWLTNLIEGMPLQPSLLHAALSVRTACPVCGQDNVKSRCAHDASFVADVGVDEVHALARAALERDG